MYFPPFLLFSISATVPPPLARAFLLVSRGFVLHTASAAAATAAADVVHDVAPIAASKPATSPVAAVGIPVAIAAAESNEPVCIGTHTPATVSVRSSTRRE